MRKLAFMVTLLIIAPPTTSEAARRYRVWLKTTPPGASIYVSSKAQGVRGTSPAKLYLTRGAQTIIMELPGHAPLTRVLQVRRHATFTFPLEKKIEHASVQVSLAAGDTVGTHVSVDGRSHGQLPAETSVTPGRHMIEVTKLGHQTWRQWVEVKPGERRTVVATLVAEAVKEGAVLISSPAAGAEIFINGKSVGASPALVQKLKVGPHAVEVRAKGYAPIARTVAVEAGKTARVTIALIATKKAPTGGSLQVIAEPEGTEVYVDGKLAGRAPVKLDALAEGTHLVEGKREGYSRAEQQVAVHPGRVATIKLTLATVAKPAASVEKATSAPTNGVVHLDGAPTGALVSVNGRPAVPLTPEGLELEPGAYTFKVSYSGYKSVTKKAKVEAGTKLRLETKLAAVEGTAASTSASADGVKAPDQLEEEPVVNVRGLSSFGAQLMPPKYFSADVSAGFPYLAEARLTTGVFNGRLFGLDAGVEFRTNGAFNVIGAITKFRVLLFNPVAVAVFAAAGGGGGPSDRSNFYFNGGLLVSLIFKDLLTFTGRLYANVYSDRLCPESPEGDELGVCSAAEVMGQSPRERYVGARFVMSALLEVPITKNIGIFALVEGVPGQDERPTFTDAFYGLMPLSDPRLYGRGGVSFKF